MGLVLIITRSGSIRVFVMKGLLIDYTVWT